ncbi:oligosaccharide flippase family protein [Salinimicrobium tongyeongense]|uniref:Oligosaccharide flippase family protein n=1 Tax=Salinimicrobium tongyeongense TaxID=2809707 RepID=A0ABY6NUL2_9FLAO|nr:polysaccharide biosynthesis C-terminal domain-containing protein [Salinimicrobium tongyeongense]UZH56600.1 oligosaccharide flippase family protein [Salinimicrobium tongyeongense]
MALFQKLFKQTFIYGIATVVPRMLSFLLLPLYSAYLPTQGFGEVAIVFSWMAVFNVLLAYGMETSFFRFFHQQEFSKEVTATSAISLIASTGIFLLLGFLFMEEISVATAIASHYVLYVILILALDALATIPFAWLRAKEKPMLFAVIKIGNVAVNLGLNIFFIVYLPELASKNAIFEQLYRPDFEIAYIFIANLVASGLTLLVMLPFYIKLPYSFNSALWKKMLSYGTPILIAGIGFVINEVFDKILLGELLPENIAKSEVGAYAACYRLALFMTLFATAFRLGIEPFFFSHAKEKNAPQTYATITKYFVIFGALILVLVTIFSDLLKLLLIRDSAYWEAMVVVPMILAANFFLGIYHNLSVWYKVSDRTKFAGYISLFGAAVTLVLNFWLIPHYSYVGSAIATMAAYGSMMLLSFYFGRKYYPIPYDLKRIGGYLLISLTFSGIYFYLFRNNYYFGSILILIFFALIYYAEKDQLKQLLKKS